MDTQDFVKLALQLTTMLGFAVLFGEIVRRFRQPAVIGEMFGGIVARLFVAIVVMALVTSLLAGPMMSRLLPGVIRGSDPRLTPV